MASIKFANVLLERNPRSMSYPAIYCRADGAVVQDDATGAWTLFNEGTYDFTTYFNALPVLKLREYADMTAASLHIELKGAACSVVQTRADAFSHEPSVIEGSRRRLSASDEWVSVDLDLALADDDVLVGFQIDTEGAVRLREGSYTIEVPREPRDVELLLSTTTFKKEAYIKRNIALVKEQIVDVHDDFSDHFHMLVVDNGRTLDAEALSSDRIRVQPNANVGGAGGFTRGMIEAMEQNPAATHVLLMDDDVAVSPESIRRTYNLLRVVNDKYKDAMVSGGMLNYEVGEDQWEDTGFMTEAGTFAPAKPPLHFTQFQDVVFNETFTIPKFIRKYNQRYAAWWFCAIPLTVIRRNGLPLPVFVRCDDAEYGVRCQTRFMTMNGIGIWHDSFHNRYNPAVERYQTTRNTLIARYTTGFAPHSDFMHELHNNIRLELKKFGYDNAELVLDAFEDFMKGPDFIGTPGVAEKTFMAANKHKEKLVPFAQLAKDAHALGLDDFDFSHIDRQLIDGDKPRSVPQRLTDLATDNGQRVLVTEGKGFAVIPNLGWAYPAGAIRGKRYLVAIDWYNRTGTIRKKDSKRYAEIMARYKRDLKEFKASRKRLKEEYSSAREKLTSVAFWKHYLGMDE